MAREKVDEKWPGRSRYQNTCGLFSGQMNGHTLLLCSQAILAIGGFVNCQFPLEGLGNAFVCCFACDVI